jgi:tetratricopeptide (TPR) repeat protein
VDGLGEDTSTRAAANDVAKRLHYPFTVGHGTEQLLRKLELLRGELFSNLAPFPVPTSFLLDDESQLRVVYLGPMEVDQLLADAAKMSVSAQQWREFASPLRGRWFTEPRPIRLVNLVRMMAEAGYADDAQWYREQAAPQVALSLCSLALDLERQGNLQSALALYQRALKTDPQSARSYNLLGKFLMRQRQMDQALSALTRSLDLDAGNADAHYNLATLRVLRREFNAAVTSYKNAIAVDPKHARAHAALGRLLQQGRRLPDAIQHLQAAIQLDPTLAPPFVYLGMIRAQQNQSDEAIRLFKKALDVQPNLVDARVNLAELLLVRGELDQAVDNFRRALRSRPNTPSIMGRLAWCLATHPAANKTSPREAVDLAEQLAKATQYRSFQALDILAASYADIHQYGKAVTTIQNALDLEAIPPELAEQMRQRLNLYKAEQPYRIGTQAK